MIFLTATSKRQLLAAAVIAGTMGSASVASARPYPLPPPGWAGPHYYWHGHTGIIGHGPMTGTTAAIGATTEGRAAL